MTTQEIAAHPLFGTLVLVCRHANAEQCELIAARMYGHEEDVQEARDALRNAESSALMLAGRIAGRDRIQRVAILTAAYSAA